MFPLTNITVWQEYWFLFDQYSLEESRFASSGKLPASTVTLIRRYVDWLPIHPDLNSVARCYLSQGVPWSVCMVAPAPFCCSRRTYAEWMNVKDAAYGNLAVKAPLDPKKYMRPRIKDVDGPAIGDIDADSSDDSGNDELFYVEDYGVNMPVSLVVTKYLSENIQPKMLYVDKHVLLHRLFVGMHVSFGSNNPSLNLLMSQFLPETSAALLGIMQLPTSVGMALIEDWKQLASRAEQAAQKAAEDSIPSFIMGGAYRT